MKLRCSALVVAVLVATVSILTFVPLSAEAAQRIWTTDADFTVPGAGGSTPTFNGLEVVGTGNPASVQLLKDTTDWNDAAPSGPPSARESVSFAYAGNGVSLLFGGWDGGGYSDETWEYNASANSWTKLTLSPRPVSRGGAGMAYDPSVGVVVLFGGTDGINVFTDTWEFDLTLRQWSQVVPAQSPPMMQDTPLVYHASTARHILFGMNIGTMGMETWAYDAALNTWANRAPSGSPSPRVQHAFAYHQLRGRTVLFGGGTFGGGILSDTWEYNDSPPSWVQTTPAGSPGARMRQAMAYRPGSSAVFLFGGFAGPAGALDDTWEYDASAAWSALTPIVKPSPRHEAGLTHDGLAGVMVLFGGSDETASLKGDTWTFGTAFRLAGKYTSAVFDAGAANVDWQTLWWNKSTQPPNTFLRFQLAAATAPTGPFSYVGPNCQANGYHTAPNQATCATLDSKRYIRFLADFGTFDSSVTPVMEDVTIIFNVPPASPYIVSTDPRHLSLDVPLDKVVRVTFSEAMDTSSLTVTFLLGPSVTFTPVWSEGDSVVDLTHPGEPFQENTPYRLQISATDPSGFPLVAGPAPNPFRFTTLKTYPTIVSTNPAHMAPSANKTAPIVVTFSEPMDTATLNVTITPTINLSASWNGNEDVVTLSHAVWFTECTEYTVAVAAEDKAGLPLMPSVPNPWQFVVQCTSPYLLVTDPFSLEPDVVVNRPVSVKFSRAMNIDPLITKMTIEPDVGGKTFNWLEGNTRLTMTHAQAFMGCRAYKVTVTGKDTDGNGMVAGPPSAASNQPLAVASTTS